MERYVMENLLDDWFNDNNPEPLTKNSYYALCRILARIKERDE